MKRKILNGVRFCKMCGKRMLYQGYESQSRLTYLMSEECICYECAYWKEISKYPPKHMEVVGDVCMKICSVADKKDKSLILGGKGKKRYFMRPNLSVFESNDIWLIGTIPKRFQSDFKTTAVEIPVNLFKRLSKDHRICKSKGCFDRYNCIRYDVSLEKDRGPYNKIPANWKPGDEHCGFFINKKIILTDESSVLK